MSLEIADRVRETTITSGTGTVSLAGPVSGFRGFVAGIGNGNTCHYLLLDGANWEVGLGAVTDGSPDTLSRDTVISSSNAGNKISLSGGEAIVSVTLPGDKDQIRAALNIENGADVTDAANVGSSIHGATAKTTPVDADTLPLIDSAASNVLKKVTWANIKATLKTYLDTLYATVAQGALADSAVQDLADLGFASDIYLGGAWTTPAYNAGDFGGNGSAMTWTVESTDRVTFAYIISGKTMFMIFTLNNTTVGGTLSNILSINIPASKVVAKTSTNSVSRITDNGVNGSGIVSTPAGNTTLLILKSDFSNFTASTNNTFIQGSIIFEID